MTKFLRSLLPILVMLSSVAAADPIEGKWYGKIGFADRDRVDIGFEFKKNDKGELKAYMYEPVENFYGLEMLGLVTRKDDHYEIGPYGFALTLHDGTIEGTWTSLKYPMTLQPATSFPSEVPVPDLPKGPGPSWQVKVGAPVYAAAAIRDGIAYVGTAGGIFHAVHVKDGTIAWTFAAGRPIYGEAAVEGDAVYFVCDNGYLFKLDRTGGKELWRYDLGDSRVARVLPHPTVFDWDFKAPRPVIADGVIYVGSGDGALHAVNASSGKRVWRYEPPRASSTLLVGGKPVEEPGKVRTDALVNGLRVLFGSFDGNVYAVDRKTGVLVWKKDTKAPVDSTPALIGGNIVVGNYGGLLAALNPEDGTVVWRLVWWGSAVESTAVGSGDRAYIGASDLRRITCFDPKSGHVEWRTDVYGWAWARPLVTENYLYIGVAGGSPYIMRHVPSMTAIRRDTGAIAWRYPVAESGFVYGFVAPPAIEGTTLVIGALDGTLYGFPVTL